MVLSTEQFFNNSGAGHTLFGHTVASLTADTNWLKIGDGNTDADLSHTEPRTINTTSGVVIEPITAMQHGLASPYDFTIQVYEELSTDMWSLVLPDTVVINSSTGEINITFPQNTINGNVKIEIRK